AGARVGPGRALDGIPGPGCCIRRLPRLLRSRCSIWVPWPGTHSPQPRPSHGQQPILSKLTAHEAPTKTGSGRNDTAMIAIGPPMKTPSKNANAATNVPAAPVRAAPVTRSAESRGPAIRPRIGSGRRVLQAEGGRYVADVRRPHTK